MGMIGMLLKNFEIQKKLWHGAACNWSFKEQIHVE